MKRVWIAALVVSACTNGGTAIETASDAALDAPPEDAFATAPDAWAPDAGVRECRGADAAWEVGVTGAITYTASDDATAITARAIDIDGMVTATHASDESFTLTTATGATTVRMHPLPTNALAVLHVGDAVSVHLERGAIVRATANGALLLAVVAGIATTTAGSSFEVAPIAITSSDATCTAPMSDAEGTPPGCVYATARTRLTFASSTATATLAPGELHAVLSEGTGRYAVAVVASARAATEAESAIEHFLPGTTCEVVPTQLAVVTIVRQPGT